MTSRQSKLESILHWTREYHSKLSGCLHLNADRGFSKQVQDLLNYLESHEIATIRAIDHLLQTGTSKLVSGDYCDMSIQTTGTSVSVAVSFEGLTSWEVLGVVMEQHKQIIARCRYLHNEMHALGIRGLLEELCMLEEQQAILMVEDADNLRDY